MRAPTPSATKRRAPPTSEFRPKRPLIVIAPPRPIHRQKSARAHQGTKEDAQPKPKQATADVSNRNRKNPKWTREYHEAAA